MGPFAPRVTTLLEVNPLVRKQNTKAAPEAVDEPTVETPTAPTGPLDRRTAHAGRVVQDRRERFREQS